MCLAFYLGTDIELSPIAWQKERPGFHVSTVTKHDKSVMRHFPGLSVIYVGSHTGCGCGFSRDGRDTEELTLVNDSRERLVALIKGLLQEGHPVHLFICWEGEQGLAPLEDKRLSITDLAEYEGDMSTRVLLEIAK